jgi:hypothetical protein
MMPGVAQPVTLPAAPVTALDAPPCPTDNITLWQSPDGTEWLALLRFGTFQTVMVRPTAEQARADLTVWWKEHSKPRKP